MADAQPKQKGKRKLRHNKNRKTKYAAQFIRTAKNKARRAAKRRERKAYWEAEKAALAATLATN